MTSDEVLAELRSLGTEQNRKVYARHGVRDDQFGVSYSNLYKIQKRIKIDQDLADELWNSGNHDARVLATLIADPATITAKQLDDWAKGLTDSVAAGALATLTARTPHARKKVEKWTRSRSEFIAVAGWDTLAALATWDSDLPDDFFEGYIEIIERDIHSAKNRVRHSMNGALIATGLRNGTLREQALAAAGRIGKVEVDHGETGCKTPDATAYIRKAAERADKRRGKART